VRSGPLAARSGKILVLIDTWLVAWLRVGLDGNSFRDFGLAAAVELHVYLALGIRAIGSSSSREWYSRTWKRRLE